MEKRIFIQSFVISAVLLFTMALSYAIFIFPFNRYLVGVAINSQTVNYGINAFLYVGLSSDIRRMAFSWVYKLKVHPTVVKLVIKVKPLGNGVKIESPS